jgi:hypothetical protein
MKKLSRTSSGSSLKGSSIKCNTFIPCMGSDVVLVDFVINTFVNSIFEFTKDIHVHVHVSRSFLCSFPTTDKCIFAVVSISKAGGEVGSCTVQCSGYIIVSIGTGPIVIVKLLEFFVRTAGTVFAR